MSFITDESSIHHSHSFSNRAPIFLAVLRCGWGTEQKGKLSQSAIVSCGKRNGNSTQHCSRESSSTFRPISPYFTPARGSGMHACTRVLTYFLPLSLTYTHYTQGIKPSFTQSQRADPGRLLQISEKERKRAKRKGRMMGITRLKNDRKGNT